jgi:kallikrein
VTDGAGLIDIRIDDEDECNDIFLTCCGQNATVPSDFVKLPGQNKIEGKCGFRNKDGVGFKISGARDNETEYGEFPWMLAILNGE